MKQGVKIYIAGLRELFGSAILINLTEKCKFNLTEDLHNQVCLFESSFGDGSDERKVEVVVEGMGKATEEIALKFAKTGTAFALNRKVTDLTATENNHEWINI